MNTTKQPNKFTKFLRNHAALLLLIFCIVAIATVVLVVALTAKPNEPVIPDDPVVNKPDDNTPTNPDDNKPVIKDKIKVYFTSPVNYQTVSMEYTGNDEASFVFSSTLEQWSTHHGVDLVAAEGTAVNSMYDGTVIDVSETYGMGNIVKVDHGNNVIATYASLSDVQVVKGQQVAKGEKLGAVGVSASYEFMDGAHVHLEVTENGKLVDPMKYVNGEVFREIEQ